MIYIFLLVFERPALGSIRRLKANIVLSNQGFGCKLFTFTSALSHRFAVRPGCNCSFLGDLSAFFGPGSSTQPTSVLFQNQTTVGVVARRKWDCLKVAATVDTTRLSTVALNSSLFPYWAPLLQYTQKNKKKHFHYVLTLKSNHVFFMSVWTKNITTSNVNAWGTRSTIYQWVITMG